MSIAKKLRQVMASNFIEIVRTEEPKPNTAQPLSSATPEPLSAYSSGLAPRESARLTLSESPDIPTAERLTNDEEISETTPDTADMNGEEVVLPTAEATEETPLLIVAEAQPETSETAAADELLTIAPPVAETKTNLYGSGYDPLLLLGTGGTVDFDRLMHEANLPSVRFSAEQASKILIALPDDLPMRIKRSTVKATLDAVDPNAAIAPEDVVADAMLKKMHIAQFRDSLGEKVTQQRSHMEHEILQLEAEIVRKREAISSLELARHRAAEECGKRLHQMEQVVLFFQSEAANENPVSVVAAPEPEVEELPAFMRDETIYRLLGIEDKGEKEADEPTEERRPRSRRKVAANGTSEVAE